MEKIPFPVLPQTFFQEAFYFHLSMEWTLLAVNLSKRNGGTVNRSPASEAPRIKEPKVSREK